MDQHYNSERFSFDLHSITSIPLIQPFKSTATKLSNKFNIQTIIAFAAVLAVANAGHLAAPAAYGVVRTAPVLAAATIADYGAPLVRIGRSANPGVLAAPAIPPLAVARVAPVAYAVPAVPVVKTLAAPVYYG